MGTITRIYFDCMVNLFSCIILCKIAKETFNITPSPKRFLFIICLELLYTLPESIPYQNIVDLLFIILLIGIICFPHLKNIPLLFIKFELFMKVGIFLIQILHTLLTLDLKDFVEDSYYAYCKTTICTSLLYIVYTLYINAKRMKQFRTHHQNLFSVLILTISFTLSYLTLYICRTQKLDSPIIPVLFSVLFILIALCVQIYQQYIALLEQNMRSQILLEQNKMTADYSDQIKHNLKELHSLRHDIRNHLLIIDGYVFHEQYHSVHEYIKKLTDNFTDVPLFDTPSDVVSSLLSAKYQITQKSHIDFQIEWDFPYVHIEDFAIITILGNLIDNAMSAAGKCDSGWITLSMVQMDSFLEIHIKNNYVEKIIEKDGHFQSTKEEDGLLHGLGIQNIRSTVAQLNGQVDITYSDDVFDVSVLVPNY